MEQIMVLLMLVALVKVKVQEMLQQVIMAVPLLPARDLVVAAVQLKLMEMGPLQVMGQAKVVVVDRLTVMVVLLLLDLDPVAVVAQLQLMVMGLLKGMGQAKVAEQVQLMVPMVAAILQALAPVEVVAQHL
jgi:RecA/RadA recombinase